MDERAQDDRRTKDARAVAWAAAALGGGVIVLGVAQVGLVFVGPRGSGCSGMVGEVLAAVVLIAALVSGLPHALLGALYLRRPARYRRWLAALFALDVLVAVVQSCGFVACGEFWGLLVYAPIAVGAALAFAVVRRAPVEPTGVAKLGA